MHAFRRSLLGRKLLPQRDSCRCSEVSAGKKFCHIHLVYRHVRSDNDSSSQARFPCKVGGVRRVSRNLHAHVPDDRKVRGSYTDVVHRDSLLRWPADVCESVS